MIPSASRMKRTGLNPAEPPSAWPDDLRGDSDVERRLRAVLDVTSSLTGQDFFASLVRLLAAALEVRFAFVSQCTDAARTSVRTLAFWSGDKFGENFRYAVAGTPCERVMQNEVGFYSCDVASLFPSDHDLKTLDIQGYLGIPVLGPSGDVVGHLVVMDVDGMERPRHGDWILKLFAMRAGAEIERRQAERVQHRYAERLKTLQDIDRAILAAQSPAEIAAAALRHIQDLVSCFRTSVALFDPETGEGVLHAVETKSGLDPIRWTVWLRWLSLLLCLPFTKTIMGVGTVGNRVLCGFPSHLWARSPRPQGRQRPCPTPPRVA